MELKNINIDELDMEIEDLGITLESEELENFFEKFSAVELEAFSFFFQNTFDFDITEALEISRKVYERKYREGQDEFDVFVQKNFQLQFLMEINKKLTNKELLYLFRLLNSVGMAISSNPKIYMEKEIKATDSYKESIISELNSRKNVKVKKYV